MDDDLGSAAEVVVVPKSPEKGAPKAVAQVKPPLPVANPVKPPVEYAVVVEARVSDPVTGRIPAEVIQRIVRLNHGRFRACYERATSQKPTLAGRVVVKFAITPSGDVAAAEDGGSDIASVPLRECVAKAFLALSFPASPPLPDGRAIVVTYPLFFTRDEGPPPPVHLAAVKYAAPPAPIQEPEPRFELPYARPFQTLMNKIGTGDRDGALEDARR